MPKHPEAPAAKPYFKTAPSGIGKTASVEGKLAALVRDPRYWQKRDPAFVGHVTKQFRRVYGSEPVGRDKAGRIIRPTPKRFDVEPFDDGKAPGDAAKSRYAAAASAKRQDRFPDRGGPAEPPMPLRSLLETEKPARPNLLETAPAAPFGAEPWAAKRAVAEPGPGGNAAAADPRFAKRSGVPAEPVQAFLRRRAGLSADAASPTPPPKGLTMAQRIEAAKARYALPGAAPAPSPDASPPPRHLTMTDRIALAKARFSTGPGIPDAAPSKSAAVQAFVRRRAGLPANAALPGVRASKPIAAKKSVPTPLSYTGSVVSAATGTAASTISVPAIPWVEPSAPTSPAPLLRRLAIIARYTNPIGAFLSIVLNPSPTGGAPGYFEVPGRPDLRIVYFPDGHAALEIRLPGFAGSDDWRRIPVPVDPVFEGALFTQANSPSTPRRWTNWSPTFRRPRTTRTGSSPSRRKPAAAARPHPRNHPNRRSRRSFSPRRSSTTSSTAR